MERACPLWESPWDYWYKQYCPIWRFLKWGYSPNHPLKSILIGFSIIFPTASRLGVNLWGCGSAIGVASGLSWAVLRHISSNRKVLVYGAHPVCCGNENIHLQTLGMLGFFWDLDSKKDWLCPARNHGFTIKTFCFYHQKCGFTKKYCDLRINQICWYDHEAWWFNHEE